MKAAILQPSYIPWRGYFHQIAKADLFIFYDDVQYDKHGWRNRNRIKTRTGLQWLTIPVTSHGIVVEHIPINRVPIAWDRPWNKQHWKAIQYAYGRAPYFKSYAGLLDLFFSRQDKYLVEFTIDLTVALARAVGIQHTRFIRSSELTGITGEKTARLVQILTVVGANHYISGPSARDYIEPELFTTAGITLEYMSYNYPVYPQLFPPYAPQVSILDLLFMTGSEALNYIT